MWDRTQTREMSSCSDGYVEWQNIFMLSPLFTDKTAFDWPTWGDTVCSISETWSHVHWHLHCNLDPWIESNVKRYKEHTSFFMLPLDFETLQKEIIRMKTSTRTQWSPFLLNMNGQADERAGYMMLRKINTCQVQRMAEDYLPNSVINEGKKAQSKELNTSFKSIQMLFHEKSRLRNQSNVFIFLHFFKHDK